MQFNFSESLGNSLNMTSTNWGNNIPLMNNPNNFVTDTLMFVEDGTAGTNPQEIQFLKKVVINLLMI